MMRSSSTSFTSKRCLAPQEKVILRVTTVENEEIDVYKIGIHVHLKKLMLYYCERRNLDYRTLRFMFNGRFIRPRQTPAQLLMKNDDTINTVMETS
ncbi:Rad60/SUMO-like domain-containing protein [Hirschfeldia incana]|nr:Rad60/SUMO-like domain-containing protein [Hirschfeldia incana]